VRSEFEEQRCDLVALAALRVSELGQEDVAVHEQAADPTELQANRSPRRHEVVEAVDGGARRRNRPSADGDFGINSTSHSRFSKASMSL